MENEVDLTLLTLNTKKHFKPDEEVPQHFKNACKYQSIEVDTDTTALGAFFNLFSSSSYFVSRFYNSEVNARLIHLLTNNAFQIIQIEGIFMCVYLDTIKAHSKAKMVVRTHNVEHKIWQRHIATEKNPFKKIYLKIQNKRLKKFELNSLNQIHAAVTISADDLNAFKGLHVTCKLFTSITGLNLQNYQLDSTLTLNQRSLFYFASMDWMPNQEAVDWFLQHCWPFIQAKDATINFIIAGRNIPSKYSTLKDKNIQVIENVLNPIEFYSKHNVLIVPLLSGSGVRIKIIEGMAYGKPIISTSIGAEGIQAIHSENIIIADTAQAFASAVLDLMNDLPKQKQLSNKAKLFAQQHFENKKITSNLLSFYRQLLQD